MGENSFTQAFQAGDGPVLVKLSSIGTLERPRLHVALTASEKLGKERVDAALAHLRWYLSLDDDLRPFYALARRDDPFQLVLARLYGYHQVKFPTLFSCLCWASAESRAPNGYSLFLTRVALHKKLKLVENEIRARWR